MPVYLSRCSVSWQQQYLSLLSSPCMVNLCRHWESHSPSLPQRYRSSDFHSTGLKKLWASSFGEAQQRGWNTWALDLKACSSICYTFLNLGLFIVKTVTKRLTFWARHEDDIHVKHQAQCGLSIYADLSLKLLYKISQHFQVGFYHLEKSKMFQELFWFYF